MRIRGKLDIKPEDILFYRSVASVSKDPSKRIADELTPSFIIEESIIYYSDIEEYEICQQIKSFYDKNPSFLLYISRAEWFGTIKTIKKEKKI